MKIKMMQAMCTVVLAAAILTLNGTAMAAGIGKAASTPANLKKFIIQEPKPRKGEQNP